MDRSPCLDVSHDLSRCGGFHHGAPEPIEALEQPRLTSRLLLDPVEPGEQQLRLAPIHHSSVLDQVDDELKTVSENSPKMASENSSPPQALTPPSKG